MRRALASLFALLLAPPPGAASEPDFTAPLPPAVPWDGASRALLAAAEDPWITPAEARGLAETPRYDETVAWLERLAAAAPEVELVPLATSAEGRPIWMAVVSAEGAADARALHASGKPVLFAHAGIHAGEIDGKDAGLMLLRDLTVGGAKRHLLDGASFLFVPILNVDGHERFTPYSRLNQRGPAAAGWRTTSRNLNINRDFAKLDAVETRAVVAVLRDWRPDLYLDLHVTDGADYQYDITFGFNGPHAWSPAIGDWLATRFRRAVEAHLRRLGHVPGPLVFTLDPAGDPGDGLVEWTAEPRFSHGYGDARHLPTVLVENHSLKPYDQRVLGTYGLLEASLALLGEQGADLRRAVAADAARRPGELALGWRVPAQAVAARREFLGIERREEVSPVSGAAVPVWTGRPVTLEVPSVVADEPTARVELPAAYWLPPAWGEVIDRLALHGIAIERLTAPRELELEVYRLEEPVLDAVPFEGRVRVTARPVRERRRRLLPAGSARVATDQPLGVLAALLLEPAAGDSFLQWGFFHEILTRTEYAEDYVLEPLARRLLATDPDLAAEFEARLASDAAFAADPAARLEWFYRRTPWADAEWRVYPVAREPAGER